MSNSKIKKVKALFDYIRRHNDELSFNKNDVITLTQQIDGGWWEGTLDQMTGWFPSNYVTDIEEEKEGATQVEIKNTSDSHLLTFQADIVNHILDGEKKYTSKVSHMLTTILQPLLKISELNLSKIQRLCDSLHTIIPIHRQLIEGLEEMKSTNKNRVGRLYLDMASKISESYYEYASIHLFVIYNLEVNRSVVQSHFESQRMMFDWSQVKQLLSLVFDRLSRYSLLLKEMERYLEDGHADRGDIQRAIVVYTEINENCNLIRKKKDRDLDILCANILGWKGERLSQLGDPILTIKVSYIGPSGPVESQKVLNHVVVVMPAYILLLACTEQADIYTFKSKLAIEKLSVFFNDECNVEMRSELTGEYLHLVCDSSETRNELVLSIKQASQILSQASGDGNKSGNLTDSTSTAVSMSSDTGQIPNIARSAESKSNEHISNDSSSASNTDQSVTLRQSEFNLVYKSPSEQLRILRPDPPAAANLMSCLQPVPVTRSSSGAGGQFSPKAARRKKEGRLKSAINPEEVLRVMDSLKESSPKIKDDALVLQVIESYCVSSKGNNSLDLARIRLSDAEIIRSSNNWTYNDHALKQPRNHIAESVRGRESSGSSNTTASGENNQANRRMDIVSGNVVPCQLNIRGHERGGCACVAQIVPSKPIGCAPMISGRSKKKS